MAVQKEMHATPWCTRACKARAKQAEHAKRVQDNENRSKRERQKEKGRERLSALGSQDALVTAGQVSPGIDAGARNLVLQEATAAKSPKTMSTEIQEEPRWVF